MLTIKYETGFKKDYKRIVKRGYDVALLEEVINQLANKIPLPKLYINKKKRVPRLGNNAVRLKTRFF